MYTTADPLAQAPEKSGSKEASLYLLSNSKVLGAPHKTSIKYIKVFSEDFYVVFL